MFEKRFCAHRGLSALMPENTLPAFAAAIALGADEIELDVRLTKDKELVVSHDPNLERVSDGPGQVGDYTLEELRQLNLGVHHGWVVHFCTLEEVFQQFANKVVFNIHLKDCPDDIHMVTQVKALAEKYNAIDSIYLAATSAMALARAFTPPIMASLRRLAFRTSAKLAAPFSPSSML